MDDHYSYLSVQIQNPNCQKEYEALAPEYEAIQTEFLSWDPDFTKTTPVEAMAINYSAAEMANGDYLTDSDINWN